jgi:hypothetical protein
MVILTLQATSAKALAVPPQKACYKPSPFVHTVLWAVYMFLCTGCWDI